MRKLAYYVLAIVLGTLSLTVLTDGSASATDNGSQTLQTQPDNYKMWAGSGMYSLGVLDNDPDAQTTRRTTVGAVNTDGDGNDGVTLDEKSGVITLAIPRRRVDDINFDYQLKDVDTGETSDWTHVYIDVKPTTPMIFKQPRPGRLKLINKNAGRAQCWWGTPTGSSDTSDGHAWISANSSKVVKIHRKTLYMICTIGKLGATLADRTLRHLR